MHLKELSRFFSHIKGYRFVYWTTILAAVCLRSVINILMSYINKGVFNAVEYNNLIQMKEVAVLGVILIVLAYIYPWTRYFNIIVVRRLMQDMKLNLFRHMENMEVNYFERYHSGDSIQRLSVEIESLKTAYFTEVFTVMGSIIGGISYLIIMCLYDYKLALVAIFLCIISVRSTIVITQYIKKDSQKIQKEMSKLTQYLCDIIAGFMILKMFKGASTIIKRYMNQNEVLTQLTLNRLKKRSFLGGVNFALNVLSNIGIIIVGVFFVQKGYTDYGTIMAIITLQFSLSEIVLYFGTNLSRLQVSLVCAERVFEIFDIPKEKLEGGEISILHMEELAIYFENVYFKYGEEEKNILEDTCFSILKRQKVALIGTSGSGKSTILKLLLGLYQTHEGYIAINNKPIQHYTLEELRNQMAYIPQNSYLFEGTIKDNISLGNKMATEQQIIEAAKKAYAHDFIMAFPSGYDTFVNLSGSNLSGGQKQRIAIARAFLKDAPILLLDEATSGLDAESEDIVQKGLETLMHKRTVIIVTHRPSVVKNCDVFFRVEEGRLKAMDVEDLNQAFNVC